MSWSVRIATLSKGVPAPYPAPPGFHWEYVTSNGERVTSNGEAVVSLVRN